MAVQGIDRVVVATDDDRIADHARDFGAEVVMTSRPMPATAPNAAPKWPRQTARL